MCVKKKWEKKKMRQFLGKGSAGMRWDTFLRSLVAGRYGVGGEGGVRREQGTYRLFCPLGASA